MLRTELLNLSKHSEIVFLEKNIRSLLRKHQQKWERRIPERSLISKIILHLVIILLIILLIHKLERLLIQVWRFKSMFIARCFSKNIPIFTIIINNQYSNDTSQETIPKPKNIPALRKNLKINSSWFDVKENEEFRYIINLPILFTHVD